MTDRDTKTDLTASKEPASTISRIPQPINIRGKVYKHALTLIGKPIE